MISSIDRVIQMLLRIDGGIQRLQAQNIRIMAMISSVLSSGTPRDQIVVLLNQISQQITDAMASGDPVVIQSIVDQIDANAQVLSDAIAANQPTPDPNAAAMQDVVDRLNANAKRLAAAAAASRPAH